jgi:ATP-dependent exoDNAse (exonuclease V) beta subunit
MTTPLDQHARDQIASDLDSTLIVEAAAGTGKTTELVRRILRILATGRTTIDRIVAVTFTEKAAGELKLRLREALERERRSVMDERTRDRLDAALTHLEEAHVSTIHGFCADLLRERPVEAAVDPLFTVLTEPQAERLFSEAFAGWVQAEMADPPEGLRRALRRSAGQPFMRPGVNDPEYGPLDRLRQAAWDLAQWRDFPTDWTRRPFDREADIDRLAQELRDLATLTSSPSYGRDFLYLDTAPARHASQEIELQRSIGLQDYDGWEARLVDLSRNRTFVNPRHGRGPGYKQGVTRADVIEAVERARTHLDQFRMDADADLAALLQLELAGVVGRYRDVKRRSGSLDFLDLLLEARNLVRGSASARHSFHQRFTHVFVDEFQDTDPLQAEILLLLTASDPSVTNWHEARPEPGRLFIVGDPKQSIYRFRRADVGVYREVCERLKRCGATPVTLTTSFRSVPEIQACINAAFAPRMTGDTATLQADYVPLSPFRTAIANQPAVIALPIPEPYGHRQISMIAIERSLPDAIGAFVDWLVTRSHWKVTVRGGETPPPRRAGERASGTPGPEPIKARHICILFRRFVSFGQDMTEPYVQALEARAVPQVLVGGKTFHDREEVETLRAALAAIEWPDDELSVFATLRGALFSIGDEELLQWRHTFGSFHPFRIPRDLSAAPGLEPIAGALAVLQRLHRRRNYVPIADTIQQLLAETRAHVGFVLRSGGEQTLANVLHVAELARQYELAGGISFRRFVDELRTAAEGIEAPEAPILEEGSDGIRLMTVHKAKGLEFPVVILADPTCKLSRVEPGRWLDPDRNLCALKLAGLAPVDLLLHGNEELAREQAEAVRLTYVAATRARDILVVPVLGDDPYQGGWLDPLMPAVYPRQESRRQSSRAPGCPDFPSKDSVLTRPDGDPARTSTVAPGAHRFTVPTPESRTPNPELPSDRATELSNPRPPAPGPWPPAPGPRPPAPDHYSVVWWDPHILSLGAPSTLGLRRDDLIVKDGDMFAVDEKLSEYERWQTDRRLALEGAVRPSLQVETVTAWARTSAREESVGLLLPESIDAPSSLEVLNIAGAATRPHGPEFGTLVHALLATLPLDADLATIEAVARTQGRILGASGNEIAAAVNVATAILEHSLIGRARASAACYREAPVTWRAPDGTLVEGTVDLAFEDAEGVTVLDFKTDRELGDDLDRYRRQLTVYCRAIAAVTGKPTRGVLVKV